MAQTYTSNCFLRRECPQAPLYILTHNQLVWSLQGLVVESKNMSLSFFTYKVEIISLLLNTLFLW